MWKLSANEGETMRPTVGQILSGVALGTVAAAMLVVPDRLLVTETGSVAGLALQVPEQRTVVQAAPIPAPQKPRPAPVQRVVSVARPAVVVVSRLLPIRVPPSPPARRVTPEPPPPPARAAPPAAPLPGVDVASVEVDEARDDREKKQKKRTWRGDDDDADDADDGDHDDDDGGRDEGKKKDKDDGDKPKKEKKRKWRGEDDDD
jgi:hypothetical protein